LMKLQKKRNPLKGNNPKGMRGKIYHNPSPEAKQTSLKKSGITENDLEQGIGSLFGKELGTNAAEGEKKTLKKKKGNY